MRTRLQLPISLIFALLGAAAPAAHPVCPDTEFRAMTYNIRLDTPADGDNRWARRRDLFVGQLRLLRPAVIGLQEVLPNQRADLEAALPGYRLLGGGRDDGRGSGEASPLAVDQSRFRIQASGMFWLSLTPEVPSLGWDAAFRRVATWARLAGRLDGQSVLVLNTHWDHVGKLARFNSALQLRDWIASHRRRGEPVVLLGDFNAPLEEASLVALTAPSAGIPRLSDARGVSEEPAIGTSITFNGFTPVPTSGDTIDHILVGGGLRVRRYHALAEQFDGRLASDHFPVIADLATECRRR